MRRVAHGGVPIDARGRAFLPAGVRTLFAMAVDERVLLVADPRCGQLIVYPVRVAAALVVCLSRVDGLDDDDG